MAAFAKVPVQQALALPPEAATGQGAAGFTHGGGVPRPAQA
jgi:hypothetical protein